MYMEWRGDGIRWVDGIKLTFTLWGEESGIEEDEDKRKNYFF
jgi:hypothetical protein